MITDIGPASANTAASVSYQSFYNSNRNGLGILFDALGLPENAAESLEDSILATQPWARGDHTDPEQRVEIPAEHEIALHSLYGLFEMKAEQLLPPDEYDQILLLGGMHLGNNRRIELTKRLLEGGVLTDHVVLLGGERRERPQHERKHIVKNIAELASRQVHTVDPWVDEIVNDSTSIRWETDMLRLAASVHLGRLTPIAQIGEGRNPERLDMICRDKLITLLHTQAVNRPNSDEPRHTTEACIQHWLRVVDAPQDARVGFVTANPHIERTVKTARRALRYIGRGDIDLIAAGSAAVPRSDHHIYLGEIARNLYEDGKAAGIV